MKKRILLGVLALMVTFAGCDKKDTTVSEEVAQAADSIVSEIKATDYIKLGEYKGLKLTAIDTTVTDEDVDSSILESDEYKDYKVNNITYEADEITKELYEKAK